MNFNMILKTVETGLKVGGKFAVKHLPTILTAAATFGVISGSVLLVKKAPEAHEKIQEEKKKWENLPEEAKGDKVEYAWRIIKVGTRYFLVPVLIIGGSIVGFWFANGINLKRLTAATAALKVTSDYAKDLEDQIKKDGGEGKLTKFKDQINTEKYEKGDIPPIPKTNRELNHTIGETPIWDPASRSWYISTRQNFEQAAKKAGDDLYSQLIRNGWTSAFVPISDVLAYGNLEPSGPNMSDDSINYLGVGVDIPTKMTDPDEIYQACMDAVDIGFTSLIKDDSVGALAVKWRNPPKWKFNYE